MARKPSKPQKRKQVQGGQKKDAQKKDPMMPFGPSTAAPPPWQSSTPTTRVVKPNAENDADLPPSPKFPKPSKAAGQSVEKRQRGVCRSSKVFLATARPRRSKMQSRALLQNSPNSPMGLCIVSAMHERRCPRRD